MKDALLNKKISFTSAICILTLIVGFLIGVLVHTGIHIENELNGDGIVTGVSTLLAVIAATYLLPLKIQPLLTRQSGLKTVINEDIKSLLDSVTDVLNICEDLNINNKKVLQSDRKRVLARHKQIHNLARTIKTQSSNFPALSKFDNNIFQPLNDSHNDFADNVVANRKFTDTMYFSVRSSLEPIIYKLREIRYKLN